jgi:predicted RNA-binding Zn ribbon-like protein
MESKAAHLQLVGGALCLDFTNTAGNHADDRPSEHLNSYADLVAWSQHAGVIDVRTARRLKRAADRHPTEAQHALENTLALREAMYRAFAAVSAGSQPKSADMALLNRSLSQAMSRARLEVKEDGFAWGWQPEEDALDQMLAPIARSAADLLTSEELARVSECNGDTCGWLFIDKSKNHSRRWCAMNDCGNREKARRHYKKMRSS